MLPWLVMTTSDSSMQIERGGSFLLMVRYFLLTVGLCCLQ